MSEIATLDVTCEGAPLQMEGTTTDSQYWYFRARHRNIRLALSTQSVEHAAAGGDDEIVVTMSGYAGDRHAWSSIDEVDARALVTFLLHTHDHSREWPVRQAGRGGVD